MVKKTSCPLQRCPGCDQELSQKDYFPSCWGIQGQPCSSCQTRRTEAWRKNNPEKNAVANRRRYGKPRNNHFGVSCVEYKKMFNSQNGVCAICGLPERSRHKGIIKSLCVDHCHETGKTRGLLCTRCNSGIGFLQDDLDLLASASSYLLNY